MRYEEFRLPSWMLSPLNDVLANITLAHHDAVGRGHPLHQFSVNQQVILWVLIASHVVEALVHQFNCKPNVLYWVENDTFPKDEIAVRLHHRLVAIHPFPNENGRHARLAADLLIERLGGERFSWGGGTLADAGELRARYVAALRAADNHDIAPLRDFART